MKRIWPIGLILLLSGCSTAGYSAISIYERKVFSLEFPSYYPVEVRSMELEEDLLIGILADYYGVRRGLIRDYRRYGFTIPEIAVILEMAEISGEDPDLIADLRDRGYSWSRVASRIGVRIRSYGGTGYISDRDLEDAIMAKILGEYFSYEPAIILRMRRVGYDHGPIAVILNISVISGFPVTYLIRRGIRYRSWEDMAKAYRIPPDRISIPYKKVYVERRIELPEMRWKAFERPGKIEVELKWKERERSPAFSEREPSKRYYKKKDEEGKEVDKAREYRERKGSGR